MAGELLRNYKLNTSLPPCETDSLRVNAIADLEEDIREVFPYLNATLKGCFYNPEAQILTWQRGKQKVNFYPHQITITNLGSEAEARELMEELKRLINETWARRHEITPSYERRERLKPMEVYRLLPGTNCRACGQPTCFTFALKLIAGEVHVSQCTPLFENGYAEKKEKLLALLQQAGYEV